MPKASQVIPYLTPEQVTEHGDMAVITGPGKVREASESQFNRPALELPVRFQDAFERIWTPNSRTIRILAKAFGDDTEGWVTKWVKFTVAKMLVRGELRDVIFGESAETPARATTDRRAKA